MRSFDETDASEQKRLWSLFQVESAYTCNLSCIMCPWISDRAGLGKKGLMSQAVWDAVVPHLANVTTVDLSGGGEPLLHPRLAERIRQSHEAGCVTGLLTNGTLLDERMTDALIDAGVNWLGVSIDGADQAVYERIRVGARFETVCANLSRFCRTRDPDKVITLINVVILPMNRRQLTAMVDLAADLGVDQVNFKHCDVIRGEHGKGLGQFDRQKTRAVRDLEHDLSRAVRQGKKRGVRVTHFSLVPEELPVCAQDPRRSLFIRYNGQVSPCIGLAVGGPTTFMGRDVIMPTVHFGTLPDQSLDQIWHSPDCTFYRTRFEERVSASEAGFLSVDLSEPSLPKLKAARQASIDAMPPAPEGCRICHYLYGI
ncbi:radical SAM protein [Desulfatiferula olefinivorans]